jgi:hypothetical protein
MNINPVDLVMLLIATHLLAVAAVVAVYRLAARRRSTGTARATTADAEAFTRLLQQAEAVEEPPQPRGEALLAKDMARFRNRENREPEPENSPVPASAGTGPLEKAAVLGDSSRVSSDEELLQRVRQVLDASPGKKLGHRKVHAVLYEGGLRVSRNRVLKVMREAGLLAAPKAGKRKKAAAEPEPVPFPSEALRDPELGKEALASLLQEFVQRAGLEQAENREKKSAPKRTRKKIPRRTGRSKEANR